MTKTFAASAALLALVLAGCATRHPAEAVKPGATRDEVLTRLGHPSRVVTLPGGGQRLQYSLQPAGQKAWMIDLDPAARVTGTRQVLAADGLGRIVMGQWTRDDVERELGPPARVERVASWDGPIMTYRWRDSYGVDLVYWVYLDAQGVARRAQPGREADPPAGEP